MYQQLTIRRLQYATRWLSRRDAQLRKIFSSYGYPSLWNRPPGFSTLVHIMLEQQVSLASAQAAFERLEFQLAGSVTPTALLSLSDLQLRRVGFSRQKARYARLLAQRTLEGFCFEALQQLPDYDARESLMQHTGIGRWTADIYLSQCLLRCDIFPAGDIALQEAFRRLHGLEQRPSYDDLEAATQRWRPWRSVATRLLWHYYLSDKN